MLKKSKSVAKCSKSRKMLTNFLKVENAAKVEKLYKNLEECCKGRKTRVKKFCKSRKNVEI